MCQNYHVVGFNREFVQEQVIYALHKQPQAPRMEKGRTMSICAAQWQDSAAVEASRTEEAEVFTGVTRERPTLSRVFAGGASRKHDFMRA